MRKIKAENLKILIEGAEMFHVKHFSDNLEKFQIFFEELTRWNEKCNLSGISDEREIIIKHFLDSLSLARYFNFEQEIKFLDLGTGAGFPGIPIYICFPLINLFLLESKRKKIDFLTKICDKLFPDKPPVILHGRAEELIKNKPELKSTFDVVTARAVTTFEKVISLVLPFLNRNGLFLGQQGPSVKAENFAEVIRKRGGELIRLEKFLLPFSNYQRQIFFIKKLNKF